MRKKFDHKNKWYMLNPDSVLATEMQKLLRDFEIQTDHLISAKWPNLEIANKNKKKKQKKKKRKKKENDNLPNSELYRPGRSLSKIQRVLKKLWNTKLMIQNVIGALRTIP